MSYRNPIIPGFHPDPSVCRVGGDYYLVTSSFEYFPGIPLYHSRDLVNWQQIGHCLTQADKVVLSPENPNCMGIFAPTLRYHQGRFFLITTNVGGPPGQGGNFVIWTDDIRGEWSDPVFIDLPGIDPSLFFEDGRVYYTGTADGGIFLAEIDLATGAILAERRPLWPGTGGADPEGPHLYKIDDLYYLFISEGGTAQCHMLTVARSAHLEGPYEPCPRNPVLTNRSLPLPIRAIGHADVVQAHDGSWWAVCLGIRVIGYPDHHLLGRETCLVPVHWDAQGWPVMGHLGSVLPLMDVPTLPLHPLPQAAPRDEFDGPTLGLEWNFIARPAPGSWSLSVPPGSLSLWGTAHTLSDQALVAWVGRRQEHLVFTARTALRFEPTREGEEAGLSLYLNNQHHYEVVIAVVGGQRVIQFRRQIGTLKAVEHRSRWAESSLELVLEGDTEWYRFGYRSGETTTFVGQGEVKYLSTEAGGRFTGAYIALFASGGGHRSEAPAQFDWFEYLAQ